MVKLCAFVTLWLILLMTPPASPLVATDPQAQAGAEIQAISRVAAHFLIILIQQILDARKCPQRAAQAIRSRQVQLRIAIVIDRLTSRIKPRASQRINIAPATYH